LMKKSQVNVKRKEVDITIDENDQSDSDGDNGAEKDMYSFPDPQSLAMKYGLLKEEQSIHGSESKGTKDDGLSRDDIIAQEHAIQMQSLVRKLEEKNKKIESLCTLLEALEPIPGMDPEKIRRAYDADKDDINNGDIDFRDSKIVALAKKSHRLQMLLNKERANGDLLNQKVADLTNNCQQLTAKLSSQINNSSTTKPVTKLPILGQSSSSASSAAANDQLSQINAAQLKELKEMSKSLEEFKKKNAALVEENKNLTRALSRELGEGVTAGGTAVTVEQAVSGGWRGRAQQIVMLKAKIRKLEASLENGESSSISASTANSRQSKVDSKAEEELVGMSNERRQAVEALTEERVRLMEANQVLEKKNTAHKARIQTLENDVKRLKDSMQVVLDKSSSDDELLEALRSEVQRLKKSQQAAALNATNAMTTTTVVNMSRNSNNTNTSTITTSRHSDSGVKNHSQADDDVVARQAAEIQRLQRICRNQADQIDSQDNAIKNLKKQIQQY